MEKSVKTPTLKYFANAITLLSCLGLCAQSVGPQLNRAEQALPLLDLAVVVLDPNIQEHATDLHRNMIWPEVRNAESIRFAHQIKIALEDLDVFERVSVTPSLSVSADFYLSGKIERSTPQYLKIRWFLMDARGVSWTGRGEVSTHRVTEGWHERFYEPGTDAFQPVWNEIAQTVNRNITRLVSDHRVFVRRQTQRVKRGNASQLSNLQEITHTRDLAFARFLSPTVYGETLNERRNGRLRINYLPDLTTEDWLRVEAFAEKDLQLTESFDNQYEAYARHIEPIYEDWQNELFIFSNESRKASRRTRIRQIVGGVLFLAGLAMIPADAPSTIELDAQTLAEREEDEEAGALVTLVGGGVLLSSLISKSSRNRNLDTLNEKSEGFHHRFKPINLIVQGNTVTLQGRNASRFVTWRQTLQELYEHAQSNANEITILKN